MKKIVLIGLAIIMVLAFAGCRVQEVDPPANPEPDPQDVIIDPNPEGETVEVTLYFMNQEYMVTGDESLEKAIPVQREVLIGEQPIEEAVLAELKIEPEDENLSTSFQNIQILSVETAENTAYVNLSSENLSGGSLQETSILLQMVLTLTELPDIEQVQIYVDGSVRETLMSHHTIQEPLTRGDLEY